MRRFRLLVGVVAVVLVTGVALPVDASPRGTQTTGFDEVTAPSLFEDANVLRSYAGLSFRGGAAILDEASGFGVTGYSSPNFLAWGCSSVDHGGRSTSLPEQITWPTETTGVSLKVGGSRKIVITATGSAGEESHQVRLGDVMQKVVFNIPVQSILITGGNHCGGVLDNLQWAG